MTMHVGRRYRIVCQLRAVVGATSGAVSLRLVAFDGATDKASTWGDLYCNAVYQAGGAYDGIDTGFVVDGDGLSHTITIHATTTTATALAYFDQNCLFYVEDIGPNSSPALPVPTTPPAWIPVTFENSWQNYPGGAFAPGSYRKIGDEVQLRGLVMGGTVNTPIFTLPVGFRPAVSAPAGAAIHMPVVSNAAFGWVHVYGSGVVNATSVSNGWVDLAPLRFSVTF